MVATSVCTGVSNLPPAGCIEMGSIPLPNQKESTPKGCSLFGAGNRNRTGTLFTARDFKSLVSTYSTMPASFRYRNTVFPVRQEKAAAKYPIVRERMEKPARLLKICLTFTGQMQKNTVNRELFFVILREFSKNGCIFTKNDVK